MQAQMKYIKNKDLGYDSEKLIEISMGNPSNLEEGQLMVERFRSIALKDQRILAISASMNNSREPWTQLGFRQDDGSSELISFNQVDPEYLETMDIQVIKGEGYKTNSTNNSKYILVNESLVSHFSWGEDVLTKQIPAANLANDHQIIGVMQNFHYGSLHQKINPLIISPDSESISDGITGLSTYMWPPNLYQILARIGPGDISPVVNRLKEIWTEINPDKEFVFHFVDEVLETKYAEEERWSRVINLAFLFTICIAWLGLFALLRLTIRKKKKEIGIRRVLGSSATEIIILLSKRYVWLVLVGVIISFPVSWFILQRWLETFAHRIDINPILFALSGLTILVFTLTSVGMQSFRASLESPVDSKGGE